ncbi:hypothetical protein BsWGS_00083 [Bradybaena similaris]
MADPKYAKLPGIDLNSPDVFESDDLPEADRNIAPQVADDQSSESVERISINTNAAFETFKSKSVSTGKTDFSDSVGKVRTIGYFADKTVHEFAEDGSKCESPQQKFQRLQQELRDLAEEVGRLKHNVTDAGSGESVTPVSMGKQIEYLQHQLTQLHLEKLLGPEAAVDLADPQGLLRKRLLTELDSFKPGLESKDKAKEAAGHDAKGHVLYELYHRPEHAQFSKNAKVAMLEERLDRLENVVGKNFDKMSSLTSDTQNKSLLGAVAVLNSKLSLLDAVSTESVEARLNVVIQKMQQITEKKETQADPDKQKQISDLYDLVKKWESTAETLPQVVDRLLSLRELHEQALQFSQALSYLDTAQQEVRASIASHNDMLKQMQSSLVENNKRIQQNVESIEKRLKALDK